jgi:hypothetical protein
MAIVDEKLLGPEVGDDGVEIAVAVDVAEVCCSPRPAADASR